MMLIEQTSVPVAALPVAEFKDHLRLGTGFADGDIQNAVLEAYLRAAMSAIEARTGKALLSRQFIWSLTAWRDASVQALPLAPISTVLAVNLIDAAGVGTAADAASYRLVQDMHRPKLKAVGACLPGVPFGGSVEITFEAGFGSAWADLPGDLSQAVMLLAALYYEHRLESDFPRDSFPMGVQALTERYRNLRILGGGAS